MNAQELLHELVQKALTDVYALPSGNIAFQKTRKEFEGDFTLVTFAFTKETKKSPEVLGQEIGAYLLANSTQVKSFNVVKGFLNISLSDAFWLEYFNSIKNNARHGLKPANSSGRKVMLEYSSPNTNKPLHLGHVRNNLLGYAMAQILTANGHEVIKTNLVNDRGIHICKSMLAWQKFGNGETPQSSGTKGDHLVGKYYVEFDKAFKKQLGIILKQIESNDFSEFNEKETIELKKHLEVQSLLQSKLQSESQRIDFAKIAEFGFRAEVYAENASDGNLPWKKVSNCFNEEDYNSLDQKAKEQKAKELNSILKNVITIEDKLDQVIETIKEVATPKTLLMKEAQRMLQQWEAGNAEVVNLWKTMNNWVYEGFAHTYRELGVTFDKTYYESNTYLLGKEVVQDGLAKGVFYKKDNGSVAIDLSQEKLDEKIVLRADGTSVYITQDLGTAIERFKEYPGLHQLIYTVGNEQDYHFKVLFKTLEKLGYNWARECYHLSYGMVELPEGKMKSREGTVVDADDLLKEMYDTAEATTKELGKVEGFSAVELQELYRTVGLGALKYFILKVDPVKKMLFDPKESIDFNGHTGPFIQYTHARIQSVLRKAGQFDTRDLSIALHTEERELIKLLYDFETTVEEAGKTYSPALVANYAYELTKLFNRFYHELSILQESDENKKLFRLQLSKSCAQAIGHALHLLGIKAPERM